jgi:PD-(D/E)XK nuclease superfamily
MAMLFSHNFLPKLKLKVTTNADGKRAYVTPEGNSYESVTTYIGRNFDKPHLVKWRQAVGKKKAETIRNAAAQRGKTLHSAAENYLLNTPLDLSDSPNTKGLFVKIRPLLDRVNNIRLIESPLYSDELQLAGTPDIVADFNMGVPDSFELAVIDVKSNSYANKKRLDLVDYYLQTACYATMLKERFDIMPTQSVVIISSPNKIVGMVRIEPMEMCLKLLKKFRKDPVAFNLMLARAKQAYLEKTV